MAEREEGRRGQGPAEAAGKLGDGGVGTPGVCQGAHHHKVCMST